MTVPEHPGVGQRNTHFLAQVLADVLAQHAPHGARVGTDTTVQAVNEWLEGLEQHSLQFVRPVLEHLAANSDVPEQLRPLLAEAMAPEAQFTSTILQIFLFGIISTIVGASVQPFVVGVSNDLSQTAVANGIFHPVDPAVLATAAGRGFTFPQPPTVNVSPALYPEAAKSGVGPDELDLLASLVGLPPAMQELFEMYRRGIINSENLGAPAVNSGQPVATDHQGKPLTIEQGLREGDFRDDWIGAAARLAHAWLTPLDFVRAAVQAQLPYDVARDWANATGLDTSTSVPVAVAGTEGTQDMFGLAWAIAGRPPGPQEMARMVHRKIIDEKGTGANAITFQQGIAESDVKTKWTDALFSLSTYVPPPEAVGTLLEHGGLTLAQAQAYWAENALPPELVTALTYVATQQHVGQEKLLVKRDITTAYYDGLLSPQDATTALGLLGYHGPVAAEILAVIDYRREIRAIDSVMRRVQTLYGEFKLSEVDALARLQALGMPAGQATAILGTWSQLRVAPIRLPTVAEIGLAYKSGTITEAIGLAELQTLGYQPRDAAIVLSAHSGALVTPLPAAGSTVTG